MSPKLIAQGEEQEYYRAIWQTGTRTGLSGFLFGLALTAGLHRFHPSFRHLPVYIKSTISIYPGMLAISIGANRASHAYQSRVHHELMKYEDEAQKQSKQLHAREPQSQQAKDWLYDHQFHVLGGTWAATILAALAHMRRDHLTTSRKLVQARVAAQITTLVVLLVTAALEAKDRREGRGKYQRVVILN